MLASIRRFAADVVKHAILGEAADPSGKVQNVSLGRMVGVADDCLVIVGHLKLPPLIASWMAASLCASIVLLIFISNLVVDSSFGYFPYHYDLCGLPVFSVANIGSLLPFLLCRLHQFPFCLEPMTLVVTVPPTSRKPDVERALLNLPEFHGCFRWHLHLLSS